MKYGKITRIMAAVLAIGIGVSLSGCSGGRKKINDGTFRPVDAAELEFPLKEKAVLTGMISYPANTESEPNNRTIFKRLQEQTNVEIDWTAIQSDQWPDKISLNMSDPNKLTDFIFRQVLQTVIYCGMPNMVRLFRWKNILMHICRI